MYPSISKYNAKKCNCCNHLCSKTTFSSSVIGRTFSMVNDSDLDCKSMYHAYVLT